MATKGLGIHDGKFTPCPGRPNCVSSDSMDKDHYVVPLSISGNPELTWEALQRLVAARPRTTIVTATAEYLHAVEKSRVFGFKDDLEFHLRSEEGIIAVWSASRRGYSDMGVNRRRVEEIRAALL